MRSLGHLGPEKPKGRPVAGLLIVDVAVAEGFEPYWSTWSGGRYRFYLYGFITVDHSSYALMRASCGQIVGRRLPGGQLLQKCRCGQADDSGCSRDGGHLFLHGGVVGEEHDLLLLTDLRKQIQRARRTLVVECHEHVVEHDRDGLRPAWRRSCSTSSTPAKLRARYSWLAVPSDSAVVS